MKCKYCGNAELFYIRESYRGTHNTLYDANGNYDENENSDMYDEAIHTQGKYFYCESCNRRVAKVSDVW